MADKVKVWFDAEADILEVRFSDAAGYEKETAHDAVMERVDAQGNVIGFSILGVSRFKKTNRWRLTLSRHRSPVALRREAAAGLRGVLIACGFLAANVRTIDS